MSETETNLFGEDEDYKPWKEHWKDMPEFDQPDRMPMRQIIVSFDSQEDVDAFSKLTGQKFTKKTKSMWYPLKENGTPSHFRYETKDEE